MKRPDKQQTELGRKPVSAGLLDKQLKDKSKGVSVEKMNETIKENAPDFRNAPSRK